MYEYRCQLLRVVDADTVHVEVDLGCDVRIQLTIRLEGLNAPEISTAEGKVAKIAVEGWIKAAGSLILHTTKDKREKYGRYLGTLYGGGGTLSLNEWLLSNGYAKPYSGGAR